MQPRTVHKLLIVVLLAAASGRPSRAVEIEPAPPDWKAQAFPACGAAECSFEDRTGTNRYTLSLSQGTLIRTSGGSQLYRRDLTDRYEKVLLCGISEARTLLAAVIARERISIRGRSGFSTGVHPKDVEREHRLELLNPKSGETIKFIDLGPFRPEGLALSEHGEQALLFGRDLQLWTREVRIYNTRSGKLEHQRPLDPSAKEVVLAQDGYSIAGNGWRLVPSAREGIQRFASRDPYSIAEYDVDCSGLLSGARYEGKALAVRAFKGAEYEVAQNLANELTLKLRGAGFKMVERERMEEIADELYLQTTGFTAEEGAAEIGKAANAHYLVLGSLDQAGTTSSLTVRVVGVEDATVVDGCKVICRECRPGDYHEALDFLVATWLGR